MEWKQNCCPKKAKTGKEQSAEGEKIDHRTQNGSGENENSIFTLTHVEGKEQITAKTQQTKQQIQKLGDPT